MHCKTLIIRGACVVVGSANFTHNRHDCCYEDCILTRAALSVYHREARFNGLWAQGAAVDLSKLRSGTENSRKKNEEFLERYEYGLEHWGDHRDGGVRYSRSHHSLDASGTHGEDEGLPTLAKSQLVAKSKLKPPVSKSSSSAPQRTESLMQTRVVASLPDEGFTDEIPPRRHRLGKSKSETRI